MACARVDLEPIWEEWPDDGYDNDGWVFMVGGNGEEEEGEEGDDERERPLGDGGRRRAGGRRQRVVRVRRLGGIRKYDRERRDSRGVPQRVRRRERGVPAQVHLQVWGEPPQGIDPWVQALEVRRLGHRVFLGNVKKQVVRKPTFHGHHAGLVAPKYVAAEGGDLVKWNRHHRSM